MIDRVQFQNFKSLKDVTLDLGRLTVLVGPNGSGKSSVLQAMHLLSQTGLRRDDEGNHRWSRFGTTFGGPRDPRRLASPVRPVTMRLAMREADGDELCLTIAIPTPPEEGSEGTDLTFRVDVKGAQPDLATTAPGDPNPLNVLNHPRVKSFASVVYLHLDSRRMAQPSPIKEAEPRMAFDGFGLPSTLAWMAGARRDVLSGLVEELRRVVPGVQDVVTDRYVATERVVEPLVVEGQVVYRVVPKEQSYDRFALQFDNGARVPADLLSDGTVLALGLLTKLREPKRPRLFLLDDIDRGLHISAQAELVGVLRALLTEHKDLQVVCTTHSPYLLSMFGAEEVRVLALDSDRHTHAKPLPAHPDFERWRYGTQTGELWAALGDAWVVPTKPPGEVGE